MHRNGHADGRVHPVDLDERDGERKVGEPRPFVLLGHEQAEQAQLARLLDLRGGELLFPVPLRRPGPADVASEVAREVANRGLLFRQREVH